MFSISDQLLPSAIVGAANGGIHLFLFKSPMDKKLLYIAGASAASELLAGMLSQTLEKPILGMLPASNYTVHIARAASSGAIFALFDKFVLKSGDSILKSFLVQAGASFGVGSISSSLAAAYK